MAKGKRSSKAPKVTSKAKEEPARLTLEALDAISSDEDEEYSDNEEMNAEAAALRQAISEGAFDHLLDKSKKDKVDDAIMEVSLGDDDDSDEGGDGGSEEEKSTGLNNEEEDSDEDEAQEKKHTTDGSSGKALAAVYQELRSAKKGMPWAETFCIIPEKPLPFGAGGNDGNPLDIHDDLKRELAFYNMALDAANQAQAQCKNADIPFTRPEDFFAEMVKTDGMNCDLVLLMFLLVSSANSVANFFSF